MGREGGVKVVKRFGWERRPGEVLTKIWVCIGESNILRTYMYKYTPFTRQMASLLKIFGYETLCSVMAVNSSSSSSPSNGG